MRLRAAEIEQLAAAITTALVAHEFVHVKAPPAVITQRIAALITRNFDEERALEEEAERLAATHARQMVGMDHRKIVQGIKDRLARERGFSLWPMRFSEGRLSHLAHLVVSTLRQDGLADIENDRLVLADVKRVLVREQELDERIDAMARRKIDSLSRQVPPGSREWDILYRQYAEEERRKLKPGGAWQLALRH